MTTEIPLIFLGRKPLPKNIKQVKKKFSSTMTLFENRYDLCPLIDLAHDAMQAYSVYNNLQHIKKTHP